MAQRKVAAMISTKIKVRTVEFMELSVFRAKWLQGGFDCCWFQKAI